MLYLAKAIFALQCAAMEPKTERSSCRFSVQGSDAKPFLVIQLYQNTIPALKGTSVGFDLLGGTRMEAARKLADMLNEYVLDVFVTNGETA